MDELMEYRFIYRLMPMWKKFLYSFKIMAKNKSGRLFLGNGYALNFETMTIDNVSEDMEG